MTGMGKALIAMSGGVDSSVAAKLMLDAGYECIGCTMKLFEASMPEEADLKYGGNTKVCCSADDTEDARSVAYKLGMPFYAFNYKDDFKKCVIDRFYSALYPTAPESLRKTAMFLSSGDPDMYDGAKFSYDGDFLGYLGLEGCGIFTNHDNDVFGKIRKMADSL